jgi:hypothetical protein
MKTSPNYTNDQTLFCRREKFRRGPIAVVSGLLNSKKLLRCTFGDNLERRPKCWIGVLRDGGIVMYASIAHPFLLMV